MMVVANKRNKWTKNHNTERGPTKPLMEQTERSNKIQFYCNHKRTLNMDEKNICGI